MKKIGMGFLLLLITACNSEEKTLLHEWATEPVARTALLDFEAPEARVYESGDLLLFQGHHSGEVNEQMDALPFQFGDGQKRRALRLKEGVEGGSDVYRYEISPYDVLLGPSEVQVDHWFGKGAWSSYPWNLRIVPEGFIGGWIKGDSLWEQEAQRAVAQGSAQMSAERMYFFGAHIGGEWCMRLRPWGMVCSQGTAVSWVGEGKRCWFSWNPEMPVAWGVFRDEDGRRWIMEPEEGRLRYMACEPYRVVTGEVAEESGEAHALWAVLSFRGRLDRVQREGILRELERVAP